jgi:hypothetical protein
MAWGVFAFMALVYLATARGLFQYGDDMIMFQVTRAILERRDLALDLAHDTGFMTAPRGSDGRFYSQYGIAQSLVAIPFYLAAKPVAGFLQIPVWRSGEGFEGTSGEVFFVCLTSAVATAGACAVLFLLALALGYGGRVALALALLLGLATMAWHYARVFLSEPLAMLAILVAFYGLVRWRADPRARWLLLSGLGLGTAIAARTFNLALAAPIAAYLGLLAWSGRRAPIASLALWSVPIAGALLLIGAYDFVRFGDPLNTGYGGLTSDFPTPLHVGVYGLLLSSGKGVFFFNPILALGLIGAVPFHRAQPGLSRVVLLAAVIYLTLYGKWYAWDGGGVWGPRFLLPILPLLLLPVAPVLASARGAAARTAVAALVALSLFVQLLSVVVPFGPYVERMSATPELYEKYLWNPQYAPVLVHVNLLLHRTYPPDLAFVTFHSLPLLLVSVAALGACLGLATTYGRAVTGAPGRAAVATGRAAAPIEGTDGAI